MEVKNKTKETNKKTNKLREITQQLGYKANTEVQFYMIPSIFRKFCGVHEFTTFIELKIFFFSTFSVTSIKKKGTEFSEFLLAHNF